MKSVLFTTLLLASFTARSESLINCWDHTFSYTRLYVDLLENDGNTLVIKMSSQQQSKFKDFALAPLNGWGLFEIEVIVSKSDCTIEPNTDLLTCESNAASVAVSFDETFNHRHIFRLSPKNLKFANKLIKPASNIKSASFVPIEIPFVKSELSLSLPNEAKERKVVLSFPVEENGKCQ